jgi:3-hydroxyanthranilate 3,4-dioxygenase
MFIGGPNQRKDYHIDEGEEFFYQRQGDMVLKVVEKGVHKDIPIRQGEVFLLPSCVPHSPQRYQDTVGFVMERERCKDEFDGLRYYVDGTTDILWEEWFYCYDLGTQLGPVIKKFFASEECKTGQPPPGKIFPPPPTRIDVTTTLMEPFNLQKWLQDNAEDIKSNGSKLLFGGDGEFKYRVWGSGASQDGCNPGETFIWQLEGEGSVTCDDVTHKLIADDCILIKANEKFSANTINGYTITVTTDPLANKKQK